MISLNQVSVRFGVDVLLNEISLIVNPKERIGLAGKNGAGKTTILRLFMGLMPPSDGKVVVPKDTRLGHLPQHMEFSDTRNVFEETESAFEEVIRIEKEIPGSVRGTSEAWIWDKRLRPGQIHPPNTVVILESNGHISNRFGKGTAFEDIVINLVLIPAFVLFGSQIFPIISIYRD